MKQNKERQLERSLTVLLLKTSKKVHFRETNGEKWGRKSGQEAS